MFSLIITIISIALVAALALATIYYGGDAFTKGGDAAKASQLINEGQQLQGANTLRKVDTGGTQATVVADLVPNYLAQAPAGWEVAGSTFEVAVPSMAVCNEVNAKANIAAVTETDDTATAGLAADKVYGCVSDGAGAGAAAFTMVYKF
jgi:hypothetical protein